ncbi:MAG: 50S ribosomal protein L25 [Candidatus Dojkabacteria bacterium]|jgi:large subunit ribosomal protein L25|nr:50S ribosomal protein L25 [Candidatus Dojkabacteria bacterium]
MEKLKLQKREVTGKKVKALREQGLVPAVVYNSKTESYNTVILKSDAQKLYRNATSTTIFDTEIDGRDIKCVVKDFDTNSVTGEINHVSIFEIDENAPMVFTVPFKLVGVSPAVKNNLGILVNALDSVDVRCQLKKLQPEIAIDISNLTEPGQTISVEDITLPEGMTLVNDDVLTTAIVTIADAQKIEDAMVAEKEAEEEAAAEAAAETATEEGETVEGEEGTEEAATEEQPTE